MSLTFEDGGILILVQIPLASFCRKKSFKLFKQMVFMSFNLWDGGHIFWCRSHWCQHWYRCDIFLSAQYLVNQWLDYYRCSSMYNDIMKNRLDFGDLVLIFKTTAVEKLENNSWGTSVFSENTVTSFMFFFFFCFVFFPRKKVFLFHSNCLPWNSNVMSHPVLWRKVIKISKIFCLPI